MSLCLLAMVHTLGFLGVGRGVVRETKESNHHKAMVNSQGTGLGMTSQIMEVTGITGPCLYLSIVNLHCEHEQGIEDRNTC